MIYMHHSALMTAKDHADIEAAKAMLANGKALRLRVLRRLRQRAWRANREKVS